MVGSFPTFFHATAIFEAFGQKCKRNGNFRWSGIQPAIQIGDNFEIMAAERPSIIQL
jgi:hypothetical protein